MSLEVYSEKMDHFKLSYFKAVLCLAQSEEGILGLKLLR